MPLIQERPVTPASRPGKVRSDTRQPVTLLVAVALAVILVAALVVTGFPYYTLPPEERPLSPLHALLRSSGIIGLKLGILGVLLFGVLFLYPLRKRWKWLAGIGNTRRWLNAHVFVGITAPIVITFHAAFKSHGLAGVAYWIMVIVACSGFVGRYLYAKIPRRLNAVKLDAAELEAVTATLTSQVGAQGLFSAADFLPLLNIPSAEEIRSLNLLHAWWIMLRLDVARPFQVGRLRRRVLAGSRKWTTLGGLLSSHDQTVESIVSNVRRLAGLRTATAFLHKTERVFHLWHVIHRPFSLSFVVLVVIHVCVALSVGVR